jgi:hypothetical protein
MDRSARMLRFMSAKTFTPTHCSVRPLISNSTGSACTQVPGPVGPYTGGSTARISKISPKGVVTTVASGFPSTQDAMGDRIGVADVVFLDDVLYAVVAGGGCSHEQTR